MDFGLTEEQRIMLDTARDFSRSEIRPLANQHYHQDQRIPAAALDEVIKKANQLRLLDYYFPESFGGLGIEDRTIACLITEELAWGDAGIAVHLMASGLTAKAIDAMGTEDQKRQWLAGFTNPDNQPVLPKVGAFCLTEPGSGSHVLGLSTSALREGDHWVLNGTKMFITNGGRADLYIVVAQTDPKAESTPERAAGLGAFVVEKGTKGLSSSSDMKKWGVLASNTTEVVLENVRIPVENRLGGPDGLQGGGMAGVYETLEVTRVGVAASALGIARAAFDEALAYAKQRVQKKPIIHFQAVSHMLADMETEIQAARLLTWKAAWMAEKKVPFERGEGSQAKYYASEIAVRACLKAIQIHGGYGFMKEYNVGRWLNDAIVYRIWEGTSEIQKNTIARYLSNVES
ncbi:MAG: acyl-CoA dehydrogenase family protein [Planctomycetes bacterium]|nr:acyl-CoA dehydrogenase family protein [Planctomycetota bacterium]